MPGQKRPPRPMNASSRIAATPIAPAKARPAPENTASASARAGSDRAGRATEYQLPLGAGAEHAEQGEEEVERPVAMAPVARGGLPFLRAASHLGKRQVLAADAPRELVAPRREPAGE